VFEPTTGIIAPLAMIPSPPLFVWKIQQGILLTVAGSQIIVEVSVLSSISSYMSTSGTTSRRTSVPLWQILTCLLLAGLFLYNPFLAASRASDSLTVRHPASHRATVGSSELEQFTQPNNTARANLPNLADVQELIPRFAVMHSTRRQYAEQEEVVATPQTGFSSSLWFRPPPAV
jgi:hypothetical protein